MFSGFSCFLLRKWNMFWKLTFTFPQSFSGLFLGCWAFPVTGAGRNLDKVWSCSWRAQARATSATGIATKPNGRKKPNNLGKPGNPCKVRIGNLLLIFWTIFVEKIMKRIAGKPRRIILLHFGLITFHFYYGRARKPRFSWFRDFWDPWESVLMDLNIPDYSKNPRKCRGKF